MHRQVLLGLCIRHAAILDQPNSLKLELPRKLPPLHDAPPVPLKHLTWCLRNRVQASQPEYKVCTTGIWYKGKDGKDTNVKIVEEPSGKVISREVCEFNSY